MKNRLIIFILLLASLISFSCESTDVRSTDTYNNTDDMTDEPYGTLRIINKHTDNIVIKSIPSKADVLLLKYGVYIKIGQTPLKIYEDYSVEHPICLEEYGRHQLIIQKGGYLPAQILLEKEVCMKFDPERKKAFPGRNRIVPNGLMIVKLEPIDRVESEFEENDIPDM
nr:hypothetical protein [uncultured Treponema sp.]